MDVADQAVRSRMLLADQRCELLCRCLFTPDTEETPSDNGGFILPSSGRFELTSEAEELELYRFCELNSQLLTK